MTVSTRTAATFWLVALVLSGSAIFSPPAAAQAPASAGNTSGLDLNANQRAQADAREAQFQKDVTALRGDTKLTDAQKQAKFTSLYQAMDKDMLAILTPAERTQVLKQRKINVQFQKDVTALRTNKSMTEAQKKSRYLQLVQNARTASLALMSPAQRAVALKRSAEVDKLRQAQGAKIAQARQLGEQLQKSETSAQAAKLQAIVTATRATMQGVIGDKSLSDQAKTERIVALRKDALSKDLALLTPAQRTLYSRIQALITAPAR